MSVDPLPLVAMTTLAKLLIDLLALIEQLLIDPREILERSIG